jgi:hypothetical protein
VLAPGLAAAITAADTDLNSPAHIHGTCACISARACLSIGLQLQLKGSDALRVAAGGQEASARDVELLHFTSILNLLVCTVSSDSPAYERHQAALSTSPTTQLAVSELLLGHALPRLVTAAEGQDMDWRSCTAKGLLDIQAPVLGAASLQAGLQQSILRLGGANVVQQTVRVVAAVPLEPPEGVPAEHLAVAHYNAAKLLGDLCTVLTSAAGGPGSQTAAVSTAAGRAELQAAGWEVIGIVPHMPAVVQALWAGGSSELQQVLPGTCLSFASALYHQDAWRTIIGNQ